MFSERHQEIFILLFSSSVSSSPFPHPLLLLSPPLILPPLSPPDSQTVHIFLHVFNVTDTPNNQDFNAFHIAP